MKRRHFLAAEVYGYSYDNYRDHLGVNVRFDRLMPESVDTLEKAVSENWSTAQVAEALEVPSEEAALFLEAIDRAKVVVDAENPAESFRNAVRFAVMHAVEEGLSDSESIEQLVTQVCYATADMALVLKQKDLPLSRFSRHLRREKDVGYYDGYLDKED